MKPAHLFFVALVLAAVVQISYAPSAHANGPLTLPFRSQGIGVNSWFDHDYPGSGNDYDMIRYDGATWTDGSAYIYHPCTLSVNCYDGHNGIDFALPSDSGVIAADSGGVVTWVDWQNRDNHNEGFGVYVRVWHAASNITTLYGHLSPDTVLVSQNDPVQRGQLVGVSDCSGNCSGAHLHFGVYSGQSWTPIDPYGWSGGGSDPWEPDRSYGYLWSSNPPAVGPCIAPTTPYKDGLLVRQDGDTGVYVIYGQTKYFLSYDNFNAMGFDWGAIQCVVPGVPGSIASVPYDKTLIREFGDTGIYVVDCGARFLIPNPDVLNMMVGDGYANWPWYDIPPGDRDAQTDTVPTEGCHLRVDGDTAQYITCRDPGPNGGEVRSAEFQM